MIIFGFGHKKTKNLGPVYKVVCPRCHNEDFWELHQVGDYFSLFFIPFLRYKSEHVLICPICHQAELVEGSRLEEMKRKAAANLAQLQRGPM